MFTGIVQGIAEIISIYEGSDFKTLNVSFPPEYLAHLVIGFSIALNGVCLTVTGIKDNLISFDVINETLRLTNLKLLQVGDFVNFERSARMNAEVGGHFLSGHIIDVGYVRDIHNTKDNCCMEIQLANKTLMKYIFYKGYIGIDGMSITIGNVYDGYFNVHLIPETLQKTIMGKARVGDAVNIEIDSQTQVIVNTVERVLNEHYTNVSCQCRLQDENKV